MKPDKMRGPGLAIAIGIPKHPEPDEDQKDTTENDEDADNADREQLGNDLLDAISAKDPLALFDAIDAIVLQRCSDLMSGEDEKE